MQFLHNIFGPHKLEALTPHEREAMRRELQLFIAEHPAQVPFYIRAAAAIERAANRFSGAGLHMRPVVVALSLVLVVGVGTSYAAEGALPGDVLYPIKVSLNERVSGALALSDEAKAAWSAERITRRLEEAEALVADDKLTAIASAHIETEVENATEDFDSHVNAIARAGDDTSVLDAQSDFEARLAAHAGVLSLLSDAKPSARDDIQPILAVVEAKVASTRISRLLKEDAIASVSQGNIKVAAADRKQTAESKVRATKSLAMQTRGVDSSASQKASEDAVAAQATLRAGDEHLKTGEYGKAFNAFQAVIRTAKEAEESVDAQLRLSGKVALGEGSAPAPAMLMMSLESAATTSATSTATTTDDSSHERGEDH